MSNQITFHEILSILDVLSKQPADKARQPAGKVWLPEESFMDGKPIDAFLEKLTLMGKEGLIKNTYTDHKHHASLTVRHDGLQIRILPDVYLRLRTLMVQAEVALVPAIPSPPLPNTGDT